MSRGIGSICATCLLFALLASVSAIWLGVCQYRFGAALALILSAFWGTASLLVAKVGTSHAHAKQRTDIGEKAFDFLLCQANTETAPSRDRAEFVDRIHDLASKTLDVSTPRS